MARRNKASEGDPVEVRPSQSRAERQAELNGPSGSPTSPSERVRADLLDAARAVVDAYTAEAEDWNDGEFALWRKDDLVVALVRLRAVVDDASSGADMETIGF